jgi:uncharacterized protein YndB with AHSA1/START domain
VAHAVARTETPPRASLSGNPYNTDASPRGVPDEPLDPILIQVTVPLPVPMIYAALTEAEQLRQWLCDAARVEPRVGGAYELEWREPEAFASRGKVTELNAGVDLGFTWEAPPAFAALMRGAPSRVYVRLQDSPEGIDVTLEHTGWGAGTEWEEARSWHFHLWDDRLHRFKDYLIKAAYG